MMKRLLLAAALALASLSAEAQVIQNGPVTPGHVAQWITNNVVGDGGASTAGNLNSLGITATGTPFCINSGPINAAYEQLCLGLTAGGVGTIYMNGFGGAPTASLQFNVNGTNYTFPYTVGGVVGPVSSTVNDTACWNNTIGTLLKDCVPSANVVNGVSYPASPSTNTVPVVTSTNTVTYEAVPVAAGGTGQTATPAAQLPGTTTNDNASAGNLGEFVTSGGVLTGLTSGVSINLASMSLTAGDWEVDSSISIVPANTTSVTIVSFGPSSTVTTLPSTYVNGLFSTSFGGVVGNGTQAYTLAQIPLRFSLATTTTIYLVAQVNFSVSTCQAAAILRARRVR